MPQLRELSENIWIVERRQRFYGLEVGTRMTVIRLADGSLLLHSPVRLRPELRSELDAVGRVRYAVAPNRVHHLYAGEVAAGLKRHGVAARGKAMQVADDKVCATLNAEAKAIGADLIVAGCYGHSRMNEWFFGGVTRDLLGHPQRFLLLSH